MTDDVVAALQRWEDSGGHWRVLSRREGRIVVGLFRCDGAEEQDRVVSDDPALVEFLAGRVDSLD